MSSDNEISIVEAKKPETEKKIEYLSTSYYCSSYFCLGSQTHKKQDVSIFRNKASPQVTLVKIVSVTLPTKVLSQELFAELYVSLKLTESFNIYKTLMQQHCLTILGLPQYFFIIAGLYRRLNGNKSILLSAGLQQGMKLICCSIRQYTYYDMV